MENNIKLKKENCRAFQRIRDIHTSAYTINHKHFGEETLATC